MDQLLLRMPYFHPGHLYASTNLLVASALIPLERDELCGHNNERDNRQFIQQGDVAYCAMPTVMSARAKNQSMQASTPGYFAVCVVSILSTQRHQYTQRNTHSVVTDDCETE